jgi:hypothetical protein
MVSMVCRSFSENASPVRTGGNYGITYLIVWINNNRVMAQNMVRVPYDDPHPKTYGIVYLIISILIY